jgi:nucleoid DNA-binding protein
MRLSNLNLYRRVKRDGRNPSTGAKTSDVPIKEAEVKRKK